MKTFTGQSPETIDFLSQKAYDYLEEELEVFVKLSHYNRIYDNGVRLGQKHILKNFDLVVEDHCDGEALERSAGVVMVYLQHKENNEYRPFKVVVDKTYGEVK